MDCSTMAANRGAMAGCSNPATNLGIFSSRRLAMNSAYHDRSHLQYYAGALKVYCGKKNKLEKQKLKGLSALHDGSLSAKRVTKLLELVSMDLAALSNKISESGDAEKPLVEQVRQQIFSEALEVLMTQLEQEKAERKQRKQEKKLQKAALKAQKMQQRKCEGSSSSSSESSESECEQINMADLRKNRISEQAVCIDAMPAKMLENPLNIRGLDQEFAETKEEMRLSGVEIAFGENVALAAVQVRVPKSPHFPRVILKIQQHSLVVGGRVQRKVFLSTMLQLPHITGSHCLLKHGLFTVVTTIATLFIGYFTHRRRSVLHFLVDLGSPPSIVPKPIQIDAI